MTRQFVGPAGDPDKYELVEQKSAGGEGEVWSGAFILDSVHVPVAVKRILDRNDANREEWRARWDRQAEMLRTLQHPRVVQVREFFEGPEPHEWRKSDAASSSLYLVMNWAEGPTLTEWAARNPQRDAMESIRVIGGIAEAIDYLHNGGAAGQAVIHRDVKPSNVIITKAGPVLVDFGFVRGVSAAEPMTVVGSPAYMPPEAVTGDFSPASDNYSLGATAFFALTGQAPVPGDNESMRTMLNAVPGLEGRRDLHDHVLSMMDTNPMARPKSAIEWAQTLGAMSVVSTAVGTSVGTAAVSPPAGDPPKRKLVPILLGALAVVVAAAAAAFVLSSGGGDDDPADTVAGEAADSAESDATEGSDADQPDDAAAADDTADTPAEESADDATADDEAEPEAEPEPEATTTTEPTVIEVPYRLPDLSGMSLEDLTALATEEGFRLEVTEQPQAGDAGVVLTQTPGVGIELADGDTVSVTISATVPMPNVATTGIDQATADLEAIGATVRVNDVYDPFAATGSLVAQSPNTGDAVPDVVTLDIVTESPAIFVENLPAVVSTYFDEGASVGLSGTTYTNALEFRARIGCRTCNPNDSYVEYNLSRDFDVLSAAVGYSDTSPADGQVRIDVYADGVEIFSSNATLGYLEEIRLDVRDVLRLRIEATPLRYTNPESSYVYFGEARLIAPPAVIDAYLTGAE